MEREKGKAITKRYYVDPEAGWQYVRFAVIILISIGLIVLSSCSPAKAEDPVSGYMVIIDTLMEKASNLGTGIVYLSIDIERLTGLDSAEKTTLLDRANKYNLTVLDSSRAKLEENGMIRNLYFKKGLLIEINTIAMGEHSMTMNANIWRGGASRSFCERIKAML